MHRVKTQFAAALTMKQKSDKHSQPQQIAWRGNEPPRECLAHDPKRDWFNPKKEDTWKTGEIKNISQPQPHKYNIIFLSQSRLQ
jgi:hypothetical protein